MRYPVTVLLVDDDPPYREALSASMEQAGFDVRTVQHGGEALELLASGYRPRIIIADIVMPVMDGYEFLRRLQEDPQLRTIPVVVATATSYTREITGEVSFLRKPFAAEQIIRVVHEWTRSGRIGVG